MSERVFPESVPEIKTTSVFFLELGYSCFDLTWAWWDAIESPSVGSDLLFSRYFDATGHIQCVARPGVKTWHAALTLFARRPEAL